MSALLQTPTSPAPPAPGAGDTLRATFQALRRGFEAERDPPHAVRDARLARLDGLVARLAPRLCEAIAADFGQRPRQVTELADLLPVRLAIGHARRHLKGWMKTRRVPTSPIFWPGRSRLMRQPLGVVGIVSPWNYPGLLALGPAVAALAAGNRVMIKPSEIGPRFAELLREAVAQEYAADEMAVVTGDADVGRRFVSLPFDHLLFTGSTAVGRQVALAAAANLTPVTLELGGKSPAIVNPDADLARAAHRIVAGKLLNAGQTCIAPDYALVPKVQLEAFVAAMRAACTRLFPALADGTDCTSIASDRHFARLQALLDDAQAQGARLLPLSSGTPDPARRLLPPVAVLDVHDGMRLMQEELFGPLLPVKGYDSLDEAIAYVNAHDRPLALYWFGRDRADRDRVLRQTLAGGVTVNDTLWHIGQEELPFGGVGASGIGAYHGEWGFRTFSKETGVFVQPALNGAALLDPPYGRLFDRLVAVLRRIG